jgi:5-amino-6-(5-phosphoribosylamino)uracil reductase
VADVILVAAGTVRAENYGPPRATDEVQELRASRGQAPQPRLAILSRHLDLAPTARFLAEAEPANRPWLVTVEDADAAKLQALTPQMDEVIVAGTGSVNLPTALTAMQRLGARVVLVEGGPTLNGQLLTADLVDETCLTIAPDLVGGPSSRIATGGTEHVQGLVLDRVLEHDNALFLRYRRRK